MALHATQIQMIVQPVRLSVGIYHRTLFQFTKNQVVMDSNRCTEVRPLIRTRPNALSICQGLHLYQLSERIQRAFPISPGITHLNLSNNLIQEIPPIPFTLVIHLNLSRCMLKDGCKLDMQQLQRLDLSHNCLTRIPAMHCPRLKYLNASNNKIVRLGQDILQLEQLDDLKCFSNELSMFNINVLRRHCCRNLDIVKIICLSELENIQEGDYSARYLIERSHSNLADELLNILMIESLKRQYQVGISVLAEHVLPQQQDALLCFCQANNLNSSLEVLLVAFSIQEGYNTCRVQSLNPKLFSSVNQFKLNDLVCALECNIQKNYSKCENFIKHLVGLGQSIVSEDNIMQVIGSGNSKIVHLLLKHQQTLLDQLPLESQNPHLLKCLLQLDDPAIIFILLDSRGFRGRLESFMIRSPICKLVGAKYKTYKLLVKLQRQLLTHRTSKKVCIFKQYESIPSSSVYTTTPMYSCGQTEDMVGYYRLQEPWPSPAELVLKLNTNSKAEKENQPTSMTQQIEHKIRYSLPNKIQKLGLTLRVPKIGKCFPPEDC